MFYAVVVSQFSKGQEERVVVGTLDLNQCIRLPDEITGMKPKVIITLVSCLGNGKVHQPSLFGDMAEM